MAKKTAKQEAVSPQPVETKAAAGGVQAGKAPKAKDKAAAPKAAEPIPEPVPPPPPPAPTPKAPKPKRPRFVRVKTEKRPEANVVNDPVRSSNPSGMLLTKNLKLAPKDKRPGRQDPKINFG